jgi:predicted lipoprotein
MLLRPRAAFAFAALTVVAADGCRRSSSPAPGIDRTKYLRAFGECALGTYRSFQTAAVEHAVAVTKLEAEPTDANRAAARAAWEKAIDLWQQAEVMQIGPLSPTGLAGGQGLRDGIYSWPLFNRCFVEQNLVAKSHESPTFATTALVNVRTLAANDYLLFHEGTENACAATSTINTDGSWAALSAVELAARKRGYAKAISADVSRLAQGLVDAWDPAKGNFLGALATAGSGSAVYPSQSLATNAVSDAMFYLDTHVKDAKLGIPLALSQCTAVCPERLESQWAKRSKEHVRNNLVGFRKLLPGCGDDFSGLGFDDLLTAIGAGAVGKQMDADTVAAIAAVDAVAFKTFDEARVKDPPSVRRVYDAIKKITDALKTEFVGVLSLELPKRVEGDAD